MLAAVVSDGAGSASFSRHGAALVCRSIVSGARSHFAISDDAPGDDVIWSWIDDARDRIAWAASKRGTPARQFAATLVCVLASETETTILHIGDGAAVLKLPDNWIAASWPEAGEYASTTYFVTDDPTPRLRITRLVEDVNAIAVLSDGIERLVLDFRAKSPHSPFFEGLIRAVLAGGVAHNDPLSADLKSYLDSDAVNERTDDDKSLIVAARLR